MLTISMRHNTTSTHPSMYSTRCGAIREFSSIPHVLYGRLYYSFSEINLGEKSFTLGRAKRAKEEIPEILEGIKLGKPIKNGISRNPPTRKFYPCIFSAVPAVGRSCYSLSGGERKRDMLNASFCPFLFINIIVSIKKTD